MITQPVVIAVGVVLLVTGAAALYRFYRRPRVNAVSDKWLEDNVYRNGKTGDTP